MRILPLISVSVAGTAEYVQAIHKLVSASYLKPSTILSHVSPRDKRIKYEAEEKAKITGFPTTKELREAKEVAEARLRREEEQAENVGLVSYMTLNHLKFLQLFCLARNVKQEATLITNHSRCAQSPFLFFMFCSNDNSAN